MRAPHFASCLCILWGRSAPRMHYLCSSVCPFPPCKVQWRLLSWAWLVCLAFLPEIAAKRAARSRRLEPWRGTVGEAVSMVLSPAW